MFQNIRITLVKLKVRIDRGYHWITYFRDFIIISASFKVLGIPFVAVIPIAICMYFLGWFDEIKGIWVIERQYNMQEISKLKKKLFKE